MEGTITRRTNLTVSKLYDEFKTLVRKEVVMKALASLKSAGNRSDRPSKIKTLCSLLNHCDVACETDRDDGYYDQLVHQLIDSGKIPSAKELENKMLASFFKASRKYASPQEYLNRLVNRLTNNRWGDDSLRLKLLKQFVAEGNALAYKKTKENGRTQTVYIYRGKNHLTEYAENKLGRKPATQDELLGTLEDDVFDVLNDAKKEDMKPDGKYGLFKMIDDLASGYFRTGGNTKRALYLFAMVFRMTFYTGNESEWSELPVIKESETDIELNLFVDYYCNNLIRFMQQEYDDILLTQVDTDPVGNGINFKNYAEIIYLYYIAKTDMTPLEKLRASNEMLLAIDDRQKNGMIPGKQTNEADNCENVDRNTQFFRQNIYRGEGNRYDVFSMNENELMEFICKNYKCDRNQKGFLQVSTEQNTAFGIYCELRKRLVQQLKRRDQQLGPFSDVEVSEKDAKKYLRSCREGVWFCDPVWLTDNIDKLIANIAPYIEYENYSREDYQRFAKMLLCCQNVLGGQGAQNRLHIDSPAHMTRSALLTVYYYYFNTRQEMIHDIENMSFEEVFHFFAGLLPDESVSDKNPLPFGFGNTYSLDEIRNNPACMNPDDGLNTLLAAAYYQPVNGKNILDVMTVFSSYVMYDY